MIHRLPQNLINQIAAGEVVVRPASVVKELVENAIDAQAILVRVAIDNENRDIAVVDNGCGIPLAEARTAVERHTTSKIERPSDLAAIHTRGFRGEALASIASVAKLEMRTRTTDSLVGARIVVWGGDLQDQSQLGCPVGTAIEVRDLFYNTPARRKFMKTKASEWGAIARLMTRQALTAGSVGFRLENEGRLIFDLPPAQSLRDRFLQLTSAQLAEQLIEVDYERAGVRIRGFAGLPAAARKDRRHQHFIVNGRPITYRPLAFSLQQAYHGLLMTQRFPIAVLSLELDPKEVDVNVHPTKEEVRFRDERKVTGLLNRAVVEALERADLKPRLELQARAEEHGASPSAKFPGGDKAHYQELFSQAARDLHFDHQPRQAPAPPTASSAPPKDSPTPSDTPEAPAGRLAAQPATEVTNFHRPPEVIAQLAEVYLVAQDGDELLLIDQHAAHEQLIYLKMLARRPGSAHVQQLLLPVTIEVEAAETAVMEELANQLAPLGFEIEPFGGRAWVVNALPVELAEVNIVVLMRDLLDEFTLTGAPRELEARRERLTARLACHAAIRAGHSLAPEERKNLVAELLATPAAATCPHGRPTIIRLTKADLDKQFGRT